MPGQGRKYLQFAGIGFVDAWSGLEASATSWYWICRCLVGRWKYLQFAGIGFADACPGIGSICNLLDLDLQIHIGVNSGCGSICNLLVLDL